MYPGNAVAATARSTGDGELQVAAARSPVRAPIGAVTLGYGYLFADQGNGTYSNLNGFPLSRKKG